MSQETIVPKKDRRYVIDGIEELHYADIMLSGAYSNFNKTEIRKMPLGEVLTFLNGDHNAEWSIERVK